MAGWLKRMMRCAPAEPPAAPLRGARAVRRMKSFAADTGYVYEYYYEGMRDVAGGEEYVFAASADRREYKPLSVFVAADRRGLRAVERYAVAKLALFEALNEREDTARMADPVQVLAADVERFLAQLGFE
jgi:hypothetical protein